MTISPVDLDTESAATLEIINVAAEAYRDSIPADCWHVPYMSLHEFENEIAAGVEFWGYRLDGTLVGVMGMQRVRDVDLIRHAYVLPENQRHGIGAQLIIQLRGLSDRRMLVGTWAAATWAINFYRRHGFQWVSSEKKAELLRTYWTISDRQIETSVVLSNPSVPE